MIAKITDDILRDLTRKTATYIYPVKYKVAKEITTGDKGLLLIFLITLLTLFLLNKIVCSLWFLGFAKSNIQQKKGSKGIEIIIIIVNEFKLTVVHFVRPTPMQICACAVDLKTGQKIFLR